MKNYTLGFLFRDGKIILAKKKRKIGMGKWNGYGGRMEEGEDKIPCLIREVQEECGVILEPSDCRELGFVDFHFGEKEELTLRVYMYHIDTFLLYPKETEEMGDPEEFELDKVPYHEMILGDDEFMPFIIANKKFTGEIYFSEDGKYLLRSDCKEI